MKDRPTPETDALILSKDGFGATRYEWAKHSRRLERERDQAQAWIGEIFRLLGLPEGDMGALENCKLELETARKTLSGIYRWIERRHQDGFLDSLTHEKNLDRVYDALYDRLDDAEQQRHLAVVRAEYYLERYEQLKNEREAAK